jgi:hypothetical protein
LRIIISVQLGESKHTARGAEKMNLHGGPSKLKLVVAGLFDSSQRLSEIGRRPA